VTPAKVEEKIKRDQKVSLNASQMEEMEALKTKLYSLRDDYETKVY